MTRTRTRTERKGTGMGALGIGGSGVSGSGRVGTVDVVIPVYRPDERLARLLERLPRQTARPGRVILMDTRDGQEREREERYGGMPGVEIHPVEKGLFDHGGTRNLGASYSDAEFLVFLTQDAVPKDARLLERLLAPFAREDVALSYGRQVPWSGASPVERLTREFNYPDRSCVKSAKDLPRLGIKTYFCSNACAAYRRETFDRMGGFEEGVILNEDMLLAARMVGAGYSIAYAADATVLHSHRYSCWRQLQRNFDIAVSQATHPEIFSGISSESEGIRLVRDTAMRLARAGKWLWIPDLVAQSAFKYLGFLLGKRYDRLPMRLVRRLSMNPSYWDGEGGRRGE